MAARSRSLDLEAPAVRPGSGAMFYRIARRYDLLNRVLSLGLDQRWRRLTVARAPARGRPSRARPGHRPATWPSRCCAAAGRVGYGLDPAPAMLRRAGEVERAIAAAVRARPARAGRRRAEKLPFDDGAFDSSPSRSGCATCRTASARCARWRASPTGGRIAILELGEPRGPCGTPGPLHIHVTSRASRALVRLARVRYLEKSIAAFPPPEQVTAMMELSGIEPLEARGLTFGACYLFVAACSRRGGCMLNSALVAPSPPPPPSRDHAAGPGAAPPALSLPICCSGGRRATRRVGRHRRGAEVTASGPTASPRWSAARPNLGGCRARRAGARVDAAPVRRLRVRARRADAPPWPFRDAWFALPRVLTGARGAGVAERGDRRIRRRRRARPRPGRGRAPGGRAGRRPPQHAGWPELAACASSIRGWRDRVPASARPSPTARRHDRLRARTELELAAPSTRSRCWTPR